jgi:hypothetical protein
MTNYTRFPHWRKYGIVMKFNENQKGCFDESMEKVHQKN